MEEKINQLNEAGEKHGKWIVTSTVSKVKRMDNYENGVRHGECERYINEDFLRCKGSYSYGKRTGVWHWYNRKRGIETRVSYDYPNNFVLHETFRENSLLKQKGFMQPADDNRVFFRTNIWLFFDEDGDLEQEILYINLT